MTHCHLLAILLIGIVLAFPSAILISGLMGSLLMLWEKTSFAKYLQKKKLKEGTTISNFIACDVLREVKIISTARIDEGIITAQIRTNNILYTTKGLVEEVDFGPVEEVNIDELWSWSGAPWGGLPDGTSLAEKELKKDA